jgi:hypothetical protein
LISRTQAKLHTGELQIVESLKDAKALISEMQDFRVSFTSTGAAIFGAKQGSHDDLVLAVTLAVFAATEPRQYQRMHSAILNSLCEKESSLPVPESAGQFAGSVKTGIYSFRC